jgi:MarR family transcriptional regulator for hemolysin
VPGSTPGNADPALHGCASRLVAVAPLLMREFRAEMRRSAPHDLSVPLFRSLILAANRPGATVSDLANHLGVTLPTASVAVARLAARGLLAEPAPGKRRSLQLTPDGARMVEQARVHTTAAFEQRLGALPPATLAAIEHALAALEAALGGTGRPAAPPADATPLASPADLPSITNPPVDAAAAAAVDGAHA